MIYTSNKSRNLPLENIISYFNNIAFFTLSEEAYFRLDENKRPYFLDFQYSNEPEYKSILEELESYKINYFRPNEWLLRPKVPLEHKDEYKYYVLEYIFNDITKDILLKYIQNILMYDFFGKRSHLPQDLCFFDEEGILLFGTLTHEDIAVIIPKEPIKKIYSSEYGFSICAEPLVIPRLNNIP